MEYNGAATLVAQKTVAACFVVAMIVVPIVWPL
jgi:hypothetical protein